MKEERLKRLLKIPGVTTASEMEKKRPGREPALGGVAQPTGPQKRAKRASSVLGIRGGCVRKRSLKRT